MPPKQFKVVLHTLAEADTRVQHNSFGGYASLVCGRKPRLQKLTHLAHHIVVDGLPLHGFRAAVHVHQGDTAGRVRGHDVECARRLQRIDVVDDVRTHRNHVAHHLRLGGIDRYRAPQLERHFQDRQKTVQFLLHRDRFRTRPARFSTKVKNVGSVAEHSLALECRLRRIDKATAVRE